MALVVAVSADEHDDRINPEDPPAEQTPDWAEVEGAVASVSTIAPAAFGPIAPAARQPVGALSGRIVYMNCGHG